MKIEIMVSSETVTRNKSKCETSDIFSEYNLYFFVSGFVAIITSGKHVQFVVY